LKSIPDISLFWAANFVLVSTRLSEKPRPQGGAFSRNGAIGLTPRYGTENIEYCDGCQWG
jgi:hypothetical protein